VRAEKSDCNWVGGRGVGGVMLRRQELQEKVCVVSNPRLRLREPATPNQPA
jgi:hypothetical protein